MAECSCCKTKGELDTLGYLKCNACGFYGNPKRKTRIDEFGDEIDVNERKADWAW